MLKNFLLFLAAFSLACFILVVSIFRIASINYVFSQAPSPAPTNSPKPVEINYNLPYPGTILSDSLLWPIKAFRDKVWLAVTINPSKKADLYLLLADKRLVDAQMLFEKGKPDLGTSVLTKAEKYLESAKKEANMAKSEGMNTSDFLHRFILAILKHRQVMDGMMTNAPEDARPLIQKTEDYPKNLYSQARNGLLEAGANVPQNPFGQN